MSHTRQLADHHFAFHLAEYYAVIDEKEKALTCWSIPWKSSILIFFFRKIFYLKILTERSDL